MKIVCEACQAKYSIADDKVRGKVFKIRCKKCSHVIVVRGAGEGAGGASGEFATSPSSAPDLALDAGWHIVVDGEQVGPLSEGDIKSRLVRGEISAETYIWKEGLADWVKIATLAEFASEGAGAGAGLDAPSNGAFAGAGGEPGGLFAGAPTNVSASAGYGAAAASPGDLFAAPTRPVADDAPTRVSGGGGYGGGGNYDAPMPSMSGGGGGGGMAAASSGGGLTGQRHENSVLFSLSNLEALAKPSQAPLPIPRASSPSSTTTTEGSGLIDIRAMANMTLGGQAARPESRNSNLPAFSAPQFSPVAPMLLSPQSSTPRWLIFALVGLTAVALVLIVIISAKMFSTPEPVAVAPVAAPSGAAVPAAVPATVPAKPPAGSAAAPPATPPPAANEALPPREAKPEAAHAERAARPTRGGAKRAGRETARGNDDAVNSRLSGAFTSPPPKPAAEAPRKPKDDIEALLEAAAGGKKSSVPSRREQEEAAAPAGERLPPLGREEIVKGMNGVLPKARECFAQFKVPGTANAKITVDPRGRVTGVNVSGKFAGTPSGNCVESAIKSGRFAPSAGLTFDYPVPLR